MTRPTAWLINCKVEHITNRWSLDLTLALGSLPRDKYTSETFADPCALWLQTPPWHSAPPKLTVKLPHASGDGASVHSKTHLKARASEGLWVCISPGFDPYSEEWSLSYISWSNHPMSPDDDPLRAAQREISQVHSQPSGSNLAQRLCWQMSKLSLGNPAF